MSQNQIEQFNTLLETKLSEIMDNEDSNTSTIHLYHTGSYWVAFEKSAYLLTHTSMPHDTLAMKLNSVPTFIIMAYTDEISIELFLHTCNIAKNSSDYKAIATQSVPDELYEEWRQEETEMFIE